MREPVQQRDTSNSPAASAPAPPVSAATADVAEFVWLTAAWKRDDRFCSSTFFALAMLNSSPPLPRGESRRGVVTATAVAVVAADIVVVGVAAAFAATAAATAAGVGVGVVGIATARGDSMQVLLMLLLLMLLLLLPLLPM